MPLTSNGCRKAAHVSAQAATTHIWVPDELLNAAFHRFAVTFKLRFRRHGSNVPGPLEARRRLTKRRLNQFSAQRDGAARSELPPLLPLTSVLKFDWVSRLWRDETPPTWTYQPPRPPPELPLPAWLEQASQDLQKLEQEASKANPHESATLEQEQTNGAIEQHTALHTSLAEDVAHIEKSAAQHITHSRQAMRLARRLIRRGLYSISVTMSECMASTRLDAERLNGVISRLGVILSNHETTSETAFRLQIYRDVWQMIRDRASPNDDQAHKLYLRLLQRTTKISPSELSCTLLQEMLSQRSQYSRLSRALACKTILHLLRFPDFSSVDKDVGVSKSFLTSLDREVSGPILRTWLKFSLMTLNLHFDKHVELLGQHTFTMALDRLRTFIENWEHSNQGMINDAKALYQRMAQPEDCMKDLVVQSDQQICRRLRQWFLSNDSVHTIGSGATDSMQAPPAIPNISFQHLATYFELLWEVQRDSNACQKVLSLIFTILLMQKRPREMAYVAERVHRSRSFRLPIPQRPLQQWMGLYATQHPKEAIRLSKLCLSPGGQITDVVIDLMKSPHVTTGALDSFIWREICKDRVAYAASRRTKLGEARCRSRGLSAKFAKDLHAYAMAYAREPCLGYVARFNRIYRIYRHLRMQNAKIHPIMSKLMVLTGVILPLMTGSYVDDKRFGFVIRVEHMLRPDMPVREDLRRLRWLDSGTRRQHVQRWADDMFGIGWRRWAGLEDTLPSKESDNLSSE